MTKPGPSPDRNPSREGSSERDNFASGDAVLDRALVLVEFLREHCPWDRKQTAHTLVPHLLEEASEAVHAIHEGDSLALRGELGDLLLNLAFQIVVAEEDARFTRDEILRELEEKMIRRHPQLFGGERAESWEAIKALERQARADGNPAQTHDSHGGSGALEGLTADLDPLLKAHRMQERVAGVGFDWDDASGALDKVREEIAEFEVALAAGDGDATAEEMGDLLFSVVNLARLSGVHAWVSLDRANAKFRGRFRALEALAHERTVRIPGASLEELDELWDEVKVREKTRDGGRPDSAQ